MLLGVFVPLAVLQSTTRRPTDSPDFSPEAIERCRFGRGLRLFCSLLRFRTLNGFCNNLCEINQGSAVRPFARLLDAQYDNGVDSPRLSGLPNVREISQEVFQETNETDTRLTHMTMSWGQFLAHDITLSDQPDELDCGNQEEACPNRPDECIGIDIPDQADPFFNSRDIRYDTNHVT